MKVLLRRKTSTVGSGQEIPSHYVLEWNPQNGRWYPINYRNIHPSRLQDPKFSSRYRGAINRVLRGDTITVGANYDRENKTLLIFEVA